MENAVDALKTAVAVLIFIIAITASFTMFAKAKVTADSIITSRDKQEYLESADLANILYTDSTSIQSATMTQFGDRIVQVEDVISSIYRYNLEKYGVTIVSTNGEVLARFDSNTENIMRQWYNITDTDIKTSEVIKEDFAGKIKDNISINANRYITGEIKLDKDDLKSLYEVCVTGNNQIKVGAPWYGNESEIIKRCNADINGIKYNYNSIDYQGKNIYNTLKNKSIIEVINEIDNSKYVGDTLLQDYQLPTIEIVYIYS